MRLLKIILPFFLFTLLSNSIFATVSYEEKESREISYSARKFIGSQDEKYLNKFTKNFGEYISDKAGHIDGDGIIDVMKSVSKKGFGKKVKCGDFDS